MYTKHRKNILKYELNFGEGAALGINRRQQAKVTSMEDSFKPAYDLLISKYVTDELQGFNQVLIVVIFKLLLILRDHL